MQLLLGNTKDALYAFHVSHSDLYVGFLIETGIRINWRSLNEYAANGVERSSFLLQNRMQSLNNRAIQIPAKQVQAVRRQFLPDGFKSFCQALVSSTDHIYAAKRSHIQAQTQIDDRTDDRGFLD